MQPIIFEFERTVNPDDPHALDQPLTVSCGFGISHSSVFTARNSDGIVVSHPVRVADLLGRSHEVTFQPGETKVQWVYEEINYSYYTNETHIDVGIDDQSFMAPEDQQYVVGLNRSVSAGVQLDQTPEQQVSFNTSDNAKYYDSPVPEKESVSPTDETQAWGYNPWVVKEISWIPPDEAAAQACGAEGNSTLQSLYEQGRVWQIVKLHNTETQEEMSIAEFSDEAFAAMNPVDYVTTVDSPVNHVVKAKSEVPAALSENIPELAAGFVPFSSIPSETSAVSLDVHGTFEDRIVEIDTYFHQVESQHDKDLHFGREPRRAVCSRPFQGGRFQ
ncbi:MAG: hypothetical protein LBQ54_04835 [Planctomycetaceae bacterium]|nr:hypothetical protein [Planctomycetaceae bacterium]